jgi:4-hydroxy-tetrahydrodipicolinate synthase
MQIIKNKPKGFQVISGDDALALPMISVGGVGVISVIANAYPKETSEMINLALKNDFTRACQIQYKIFDMINAMFEEGNPSGVKAVLEILKISRNNVRLPLVPVSEKHYSKLEQLARKIK